MIYLVRGELSKYRYMENAKKELFIDVVIACSEEQVELLIKDKYECEHNYGDFDVIDWMEINPALYWEG